MASSRDESALDREVDDFMNESGGRMYEASPDDPAGESQGSKKRKAAQETAVCTIFTPSIQALR